MNKLNNGDWSTFCPSTNIAWLEYLLTKLLKLINTRKRDLNEKSLIGQLRLWSMQLKKFSSCLEALKIFE